MLVHGSPGGERQFCDRRGVFRVQFEVYNGCHRAGCNRYVSCSRDVLLLLLLLTVCSCVGADSRRGENNWADVVQRAKDRKRIKKNWWRRR